MVLASRIACVYKKNKSARIWTLHSWSSHLLVYCWDNFLSHLGLAFVWLQTMSLFQREPTGSLRHKRLSCLLDKKSWFCPDFSLKFIVLHWFLARLVDKPETSYCHHPVVVGGVVVGVGGVVVVSRYTFYFKFLYRPAVFKCLSLFTWYFVLTFSMDLPSVCDLHFDLWPHATYFLDFDKMSLFTSCLWTYNF